MSAQRRRTVDEPLKCDLRVEAYGEVDELNAALGLAVAAMPWHSRFRPWLDRIQNDLVDLGAELAAPPEPDKEHARLRVAREQVEWLDHACEQANRELAPLRTFILPGGSEASARLHLARAFCRRAEERILARAVDADSGERPRLWRPGATTLARAAERILPDPLAAPART